ncbi:MAG: winged helix-turn-helix domain-containing protein [Okeania sp. SIO2D1]|nr:winged helix-turn-helix domain-containing protein [Okeania sp. SIO2D1]
MSIVIIRPQRGPTTTEQLLQLICNCPQGITIAQLRYKLNRPISMLQICLRQLISAKKVYCQLSQNKMQRIYYPQKELKL